jgi:hypothetical protein
VIVIRTNGCGCAARIGIRGTAMAKNKHDRTTLNEKGSKAG